MPAVTRELSVAYAGVTVGGASDYLLHDRYTQNDQYDRTTLTFKTVVSGATAAAFAAACVAVEVAFRTPRQAVTILLGGSTMKSLDPDANTGYNTVSSIRKVGADFDSGRAREYEISLEFERPADLAGQNGRRESTLTVTTEPGARRAVVVAGKYTALGGNSARTQYAAVVDAWIDTILPGGAAIWRIIDKSAETDDTDKNLTFRHSFEEYLNAGRRTSTMIIRTEPGPRKSITLTGTYQAQHDLSNSLAQYNAGIAAFVASSQASAGGGDWRETAKETFTDALDQNTNFTHTYDQFLNGGRRTSIVSVTHEPGDWRLLSISGTYHATGGAANARANYLAGIDAFIAAAQASLIPAGIWQLVGKTYSKDDLDQACDFSHQFEEVVIGDGDPGANVTRSVLSITRDQIAPGDSPYEDGLVKRLVTIRAVYDGYANVRVVTPSAEYTATIRPWIIRRVTAAHGLANAALVDENSDSNPLDGHITAQLTFQVAGAPGGRIEYLFSVEIAEDLGQLFVPAWMGDRNPYAAHLFAGPAVRTRTVTERERVVSAPDAGFVSTLDKHAPNLFAIGVDVPERGLGQDGWVNVRRRVSETPVVIGTDDFRFTVTERQVSTVQRWLSRASRGTG
mgnify:FL=1